MLPAQSILEGSIWRQHKGGEGTGATASRSTICLVVGGSLLLASQRVKPALALSLHTTKAALREQLLPRAPKIAPAELIELGEQYARTTGYPIQYQWTLLAGVNDGDEELESLVQLLRGKYGILNMIPYNANEGLPFERPAWERSRAIARWLTERGVLTKLRNSAGQDVDGGCGQLRARSERIVHLRKGRPADAPIAS